MQYVNEVSDKGKHWKFSEDTKKGFHFGPSVTQIFKTSHQSLPRVQKD